MITDIQENKTLKPFKRQRTIYRAGRYVLPRMNRYTGWGSSYNIWGNYYEYDIVFTPKDSVREALAKSWRSVGQSIIEVLTKQKDQVNGR